MRLKRLRPTRTEPAQLANSSAEWVQLRTQAAEELLWSKNCKRCHASTEHEGAGLPQSVKAIILPRWLPRSEFDHEAHRMLACLSCHTQIPNSRKTADINIPSIALCRQCHKQGGASQLAAEGRCFECHSYHDWRKERRITGIMEMAQPKTSNPGTTAIDVELGVCGNRYCGFDSATRRLFLRTVDWRARWIVSDGVKVSVPEVESLHFFAIQRPRPTPAEDCELVARFIDCPVTIDAPRHSKRRPGCAIARDQLGDRARAEASRISELPGERIAGQPAAHSCRPRRKRTGLN